MILPRRERLTRAYEGSIRAKYRGKQWRDNREPSTICPIMGSMRCWCGQPYYHDWPGRDDGEAHPR